MGNTGREGATMADVTMGKDLPAVTPAGKELPWPMPPWGRSRRG